MSWITVAWSMVASACLTVAALHLYLGLRRRSRADLLFAASTVCAAALAFFELDLTRAAGAQRQGELIRLAHVPVAVMIVLLVFFLRSYLETGRLWLGAAAIATRLAVLAANFSVWPNANFERITGIHPLAMPWGETVYVAQGTLRPWTRLGQLSSILFVLYAADAARSAWRRGDRRRPAVVAASVAVAIGVGAAHAALVLQGTVRAPYLISVAYLAVVATMSWALTSEAVRAGELSRRLTASEVALDESERRMALAAEAADVGIWVHDVDRDAVWLNDRMRDRRAMAAEGGSLRFEELLATIHEEDRAGLRAAVTDAIRELGIFEHEYRLRTPDGRDRWISARGRAERMPDGRVVVRGAALDVSRRKGAEIEAARRRDELAHLSRVALLGELSGSLAHELKQPLTAILSNAQAAQRFLAEGNGRIDEVRQILADIAAEDKRAGEVIHRLRLLFQKGEAQAQAIDLCEVAREALALARSDLLLHGVAASTELPADLPRALGDRIQIQQVILNLVANACEAMDSVPPADRRIALRAARGDGGGLEVSVSDSGGGLAPGAAERLFDPFFTTKSDGVGLGLPVCRTIIDAHGGRLWATENPDCGATFHFTLPTAGDAP